ncbi:MAG: helix-turn-helix domain-containing protein [Roseovarius sp.]
MTLEELRVYPKAVLTIQEVAGILRVDRKTVGRAVREKRLPVLPLGGRKKLILKDALIQLLDRQAGAGTDD